MKKLLLLFITVLTVSFVDAQDFTVGDIGYTITVADVGLEEVAVQGSTLAALVVPSTVDNGGVTYTVTSIAVDAFKNNTTITSLTLPSTLTTIGAGAFGSCSALAMDPLDLTNVTSVGGYAFLNCGLITSVIVPEGITLEVGGLRGTGITSFSIPTSITVMPIQMVRDCSSITSMNIPSTIETMGVAAFRGCTGITQMQVNWTDAADIADATVNNLFSGMTLANITLYVPAGMTSAYEAAAVWTDFNIVEGVLGVSNIEQELGFSIYPNPTSGVVSIKSKQLNNANVGVYDLNGRRLLSKSLNGTSSEINISSLASGIYLLKVQVENSEFTKRIVKQ